MISVRNIRELGLTKVGGCGYRALVTHCVNGHEFTPQNTTLREDGSRRCATCHRIGVARTAAKARARRLARKPKEPR